MKSKIIAGIYVIMCLIDSKKYIGSTNDIKKRWRTHKRKLNTNSHGNRHLQSAWTKYGEENFEFSILESMSPILLREEYEEVETKWVLLLKTNLSEFGYNLCLPGSFPLRGEEENKTAIGEGTRCPVLVLNKLSGEIEKFEEIVLVSKKYGISQQKLNYYLNYWSGKERKRKSWKGLLFVRESEYDPNFDYINFKRIKLKSSNPKTWRDYYKKENYRKDPKDIIPHSERNLKRVPILAKNIETREERTFKMLKDVNNEFLIHKVYKCINAPFMKYKHRGHWFKRQ